MTKKEEPHVVLTKPKQLWGYFLKDLHLLIAKGGLGRDKDGTASPI